MLTWGKRQTRKKAKIFASYKSGKGSIFRFYESLKSQRLILAKLMESIIGQNRY